MQHDIPLIIRKIIFILLIILCFFPFMDAPLALALGFFVSFFIQHPYKKISGKLTKQLLQLSVIGLGFGMNVNEAMKAGKEGFVFTICSITFTLVVGIFLGKVLKIDNKISTLISAGTAICGGSAIASVSNVINSDEHETSVALATVFILNSIALFLFPVLGHFLGMDQHQFGVWCAVAIHDTSSVVGASSKFGNEALKIATTIKLERALWIIPVTLLFAFLNKAEDKKKIKIPYFIFVFVIAIILNTYVPGIDKIAPTIVFLAKKGLIVTLFLIGSNLTIAALKTVGYKPLLQGIILWILISAGSLAVILLL